nr:zinc finger BED domain-containing protein DAYSLEEPER-like [Tanacetum cinerariifolium]
PMDTSFIESNALVDIEMKPEYFDTLLNNNVEIQPTKREKKRGSRTASVPVAFDSERCHHEIARMTLLHDYPLHMVEHKGFMTFLHNLQPKFNVAGFNTIQGNCVATYLSERSTIENNTTGYVFITGQFIDSDWNIHKRLPSVVMELYPESKFAFTQAVSTCFTDWNI